VLPFLQPIQLSAMYLAKNLLGGSAPLKLPAMLVKVKTPELPLHLAGETQRQDLNWQITSNRREWSRAARITKGRALWLVKTG
jgi:nitric oxide reductase FlRd-NAD(+) reductase